MLLNSEIFLRRTSLGNKSILFKTKITSDFIWKIFSIISLVLLSIFFETSWIKITLSVKFNSDHAALTIAFSSLLFGKNIPGVSTKIIWDFNLLVKLKLHIPLIQNLVVCTLWDTIEIFLPTNLFIRVDLPEFGIPTKLTKPDFNFITP